jgi:amino acid adenylation domain-containing protein
VDGQKLYGVHAGFLRSAHLFPDRPALVVDGAALNYDELRARAFGLAATMTSRAPTDGPARTAVFAHRSATAFVGVLATLMRGHGYVPLNRTFPPQRTALMLTRSGCRTVIVDERSADELDDVLGLIDGPLLLLLAAQTQADAVAERWPVHRVVGPDDFEPPATFDPVPVDPQSLAYLLFTSGSTGVPKGVVVSHGNVRHFVDAVVERYQITEDDHLSQMFDLTFDLSAFDMFVAWERGACVCCPNQKEVFAPGRFIRDSALTVWFSVPSAAIVMKRLGMLKPDRYPGLRWSLFCGEPLPVEIARAWADAAPGSTLENLYGPTEATIACTAYRWDSATSADDADHGVVPIGSPFPGMRALVADGELRPVPDGQPGELLMAGPQVTLGYLDDPEKTAAAFVTPPGDSDVHYRTGDRVRRARAGGPLLYIGRMDNQIKVHGHRVELGEVEAVLREMSGTDAVIVVGWPATTSGASGLVAFLDASDVDVRRLREDARTRLPDYMVPAQFRILDELPTNANGKFDRRAVVDLLEAEA